MHRAIKRRVRDRKFIPYDSKKHLARAFAVSGSKAISWDLFPPVQGYRPFNSRSKKNYSINLTRQQADWSNLVLSKDNRICQNCGSTEYLEAHHIWPQSWFPHLRYIVKNGITLCKSCHANAYHAYEITPYQFKILTQEMSQINANIETENFWSYYTAGIDKGRVLLHNLLSSEEMGFTEKEKNWFLTWAKLNDLIERTKQSAERSPIKDASFKLNESLISMINRHDAWKK
jgi:hypothetical protein